MTALDLRIAPPRPPRAELAGVIFLPRTIDKIRATLAGGDLGDYSLDGFTLRLLEVLGISVDEFTAAVAGATTDDEIDDLVRARVAPGKIEAWNRFAAVLPTSGGDRAKALTRYPWLVDRPDLTVALDVLEEDDRRAFAKS